MSRDIKGKKTSADVLMDIFYTCYLNTNYKKL